MNQHEAELPDKSVAIHITEFVSWSKWAGELGLQTTVGEGSTLSIAIGSAQVTGLVASSISSQVM